LIVKRVAGQLSNLHDIVKVMVYFIQSVNGGPIKVGTSTDPTARLAQLQGSSAGELMILGVIPGGQKTERRIHRLLAPTKVEGEWFSPSQALSVLIYCACEGIDLSPLIALQDQELRVTLKRSKKVSKRQPMKLSKAERKRRSDVAKARHREGKLGGQRFGSLGGRPTNESRIKSVLQATKEV
jgi:hypothetical protein